MPRKNRIDVSQLVTKCVNKNTKSKGLKERVSRFYDTHLKSPLAALDGYENRLVLSAGLFKRIMENLRGKLYRTT